MGYGLYQLNRSTLLLDTIYLSPYSKDYNHICNQVVKQLSARSCSYQIIR